MLDISFTPTPSHSGNIASFNNAAFKIEFFMMKFVCYENCEDINSCFLFQLLIENIYPGIICLIFILFIFTRTYRVARFNNLYSKQHIHDFFYESEFRLPIEKIIRKHSKKVFMLMALLSYYTTVSNIYRE